MPPQEIHNTGKHKQPVYNFELGEPGSVMPGLPQQGTPQAGTKVTVQVRRRRKHNLQYPPIREKNLGEQIPRGALQFYPAGARVRGVGGVVYGKEGILWRVRKRRPKNSG